MHLATRHKGDLDTPCLVIDLDILEHNLHKMQAVVNRAGKQLRPHAKTHKCSALARRQIEAGASGVCVAKVSEAEALVRAGLDGILVTGPVATPKKIKRLVALLPLAPSLMAVVDHREGAGLLDAALQAEGLSMEILLDLDIGQHRTGVGPDDALALAEEILSRPALRLRGIQAYAGQLQHVRSYAAREAASRQCLQEAAGVFRRLQPLVKTCTILSTSGTGTFDIDLAVPEVTELQAGSYAIMDAEYFGIGSADDPMRFAAFGPALRLLTTVVSVNRNGFVTVDAGLKALYKDGGLPEIIGGAYSGMTYSWFGDEYGKISFSDDVKAPCLGTVLELVTSHCDPTVNLFDRYFLARGDEVVGVWPIDLRGCCQ